MPEIDLKFLARQMERILTKLDILYTAMESARRDQGLMIDDVGVMKADIVNLRREMDSVRRDMRSGFSELDAKLRPLEEREH